MNHLLITIAHLAEFVENLSRMYVLLVEVKVLLWRVLLHLF